MSSNTKISGLVGSQVPGFVRDDHENFVRFIEAYYEFLEQNGKTVDVMKNIKDYYDIDQSIDIFTEKLYETYIKLLPKETIADKNLILKNVKDFYRARGSEKSIKFLLRAIFNIESEVYYPKADILRASDGKWFIEKSLKVGSVLVNNVANSSLGAVQNFRGKQIAGNVSNAIAFVEGVDVYYDAGTLVREFKISNQLREFESNESISTTFDEDGVTKTISATVFGGAINSVTIVTAGTGYEVGQELIIESDTGSGGRLVITDVSQGEITSGSVVNGGAGFRKNDYISFTGGGGTGANGNVLTVNENAYYHPNTYNIVLTLISDEANTNISNSGVVNSMYETYAYPNMATLYVTTSNLTVSTGSGASVSMINLSGIKSTSNTFFETYDYINVKNTLVIITSSNTVLNYIMVNPGLPGNVVANNLIIVKKPNLNSIIANSLVTFRYANTGPAETISILVPGSGYISLPSTSIIGNTRIRELGILGRMEIVDGGLNYNVGNQIEFVNVPGGLGLGAMGNVMAVAANGRITQVGFKEVPGYLIGGSGFSNDYLPTTNVSTSTGNGANIMVRTILGYGETLTLSSSEVGEIQEITIQAGGSGYEIAPTLNLSSFGSGTAQVTCTIITGTFTYPGRYINDDGHLSSYNFLQDRDYYQNFSYVVIAKQSIEKYRKYLKDLIHPAGLKLFGEYATIDETYGASLNCAIRSSNTNISYMVSGSYVSRANAVSNSSNIFVTVSRNVSTMSDKVYIEFTNTDNVYSNLVINTGSGALVTTLNLSKWVANSNVYLQTGNTIIVNNTYTYVVSASRTSNTITVSPGVSGNLSMNSFRVLRNISLQNNIFTVVGKVLATNTFIVISANTTVNSNGSVFTSL